VLTAAGVEPCVAVERRQRATRRNRDRFATQLGRVAAAAVVDPVAQRSLVLAGDRAVDEPAEAVLGGDARVEPVERDGEIRSTAPNRPCDLDGETHGRVHRDRDRHRVDAVDERRVPGVDRAVEAADLVAPPHESGRRRAEVQWLVAQLVGGDQQDLHASPFTLGPPLGSRSCGQTVLCACCW
jgi:hypothetical protein